MPGSLEFVPDLRAALIAAGYTYDGVAGLLGPAAHAALSRNETVPGLRATRGGSPLETLTRLFLLQAPVGIDAAEAALPGLVDRLCTATVLERSLSEVAARVDIRPYAADDRDLWIAADLTPGLDGSPNSVSADHVLGISSAATSLAQLTIREPVGSALDLGTGCGVQALHLAEHADRVVACDLNPRALWFTRLNAELNEVSTGPTSETGSTSELVVGEGSFFEAVRGQTFDQIVTNPPFVISPATGERLVYRDSGMPGDSVVEHIVRTGPAFLNPGGRLQILANWMILRDQPWDERLAAWIPDGCEAWVIQREVADLPSYVEMWLKDAGVHGGPEYAERYDTWLSWFEANGVEAVGFGWINIARTGRSDQRLEEWPWEVEQPLGAEIAAHFRRTATLATTSDQELVSARLVAAVDAIQETTGAVAAEDPERIIVRRQRGLRRARQVDTVEAALIGACDGELTVGQILDALADLLDDEAPRLRERYLPVVRELVAEGFLDLA